MKRKKTGETRSLYIRYDLGELVDKVAALSGGEMNASDVVNMVLEQAHLDELVKEKQDGGNN